MFLGSFILIHAYVKDVWEQLWSIQIFFPYASPLDLGHKNWKVMCNCHHEKSRVKDNVWSCIYPWQLNHGKIWHCAPSYNLWIGWASWIFMKTDKVFLHIHQTFCHFFPRKMFCCLWGWCVCYFVIIAKANEPIIEDELFRKLIVIHLESSRLEVYSC